MASPENSETNLVNSYSLDGVHQPIILFADDEAMVRPS